MSSLPHLFTPITFRNLTLRNRIGVSPMCQYSATDGFATDWHLVHLGARASGGAGLVIMEATAVQPEGRITPGCTGIWDDAHIPQLMRIADFIKSQGAAAGIQLAHAGRKASCALPWNGGKSLATDQGGWQTVAPSAIAFAEGHPVPRAMTIDNIAAFKEAFVDAALRAVQAGFQVIELHGAHGYLLNAFLSPLSNKRDDAYGGSFENRCRLMLEVTEAVRAAVPSDIVLAARLSCTDWVEGGWTGDDSVALSRLLKDKGADFIDCSTGAIVADAQIPVAPGFQVPFAEQIRIEADIPTAAVGLITEAAQAEDIIAGGKADMAFLARAFLRDPYWPVHAALELGADTDIVPLQYLRGYHAARTTSRDRKAG
ncbi:MAG TPA: NADH:flavin oxidoreductase/NADH oxidase [Alphaproteobacteria bacterium]|nr:NADH:flavin oxidoreductase/NADH oxidase [Alphaproteobacteria bacterium]